MPDYTAREVEAALKYMDWNNVPADFVAILRAEPVKVVKVASETADDEYSGKPFVVVQVGAQFFQKTGYYTSHYGAEWDGNFTEVKATVKTVTVYDPK